MNNEKWENLISQALEAPAAPAQLVEKVFAKTTRRPSWWVRYKMALVGGVTAVVVAVCVGVGMGSRSVPLDNGKLVVYMSQTQQDEYATFSSDLDLFEQEWF